MWQLHELKLKPKIFIQSVTVTSAPETSQGYWTLHLVFQYHKVTDSHHVLEFLHNDVIRHCYAVTVYYHVLQYEFCQDSHKTSHQEMEEFQIYMQTSNQVVENQKEYQINTHYGRTQILNSTNTCMGYNSASFLYEHISCLFYCNFIATVSTAILMCAILLCIITKIIGTIKALQHNFQFIQGVLLSITLYTTCFGTLLMPSSGVCYTTFLYRSLMQHHYIKWDPIAIKRKNICKSIIILPFLDKWLANILPFNSNGIPLNIQ
jgi:hypothetical protein